MYYHFPILELEVEKAGEESRIYRIYQDGAEIATIELIPLSAGISQLTVARLEISRFEDGKRYVFIDFASRFIEWAEPVFKLQLSHDPSVWRDGPASLAANVILQFATRDNKGVLPVEIEEPQTNSEPKPKKERGRYSTSKYVIQQYLQAKKHVEEEGCSVREACNKTGIQDSQYFYWQRKDKKGEL